MRYEIRVITNWNTKDYDSFEIEAADIWEARQKGMEEALACGYDCDDIIEPIEIATKRQK